MEQAAAVTSSSAAICQLWIMFKGMAAILSLTVLIFMFTEGHYCVTEKFEICGTFQLSWYTNNHLLCLADQCTMQYNVPYSQLFIFMLAGVTLVVSIGHSFRLRFGREKYYKQDLLASLMLLLSWTIAACVEIWYVWRWWPNVYAVFFYYSKVKPPHNWQIVAVLSTVLVFLYLCELLVVFFGATEYYGEKPLWKSRRSYELHSVSSTCSMRHNNYMLHADNIHQKTFLSEVMDTSV